MRQRLLSAAMALFLLCMTGCERAPFPLPAEMMQQTAEMWLTWLPDCVVELRIEIGFRKNIQNEI